MLALAALLVAAVSVTSFDREDKSAEPWRDFNVLLLLAIAATMAGYFWFLIKFPNLEKGATIKASYVLNVFPFVAILVGELLDRIKGRSRPSYYLFVGFLWACGVHNCLVMVTHYRLQSLS
jgi:hypothetical protein